MPSTSIGSAWKRSSLKKWKFWKSWLLAFNINFSHDGLVWKGPTKLWCCYHDRTTCSIKKIGPRPNSLAKLRPNGPVPTWKDRVPTWADCTVISHDSANFQIFFHLLLPLGISFKTIYSKQQKSPKGTVVKIKI